MASKDENERPAKRLRPNDGSEFSEMTSHFPSIDIQSKQIHILSTAIAAGNKIISDLSSLIMVCENYSFYLKEKIKFTEKKKNQP